MTTQLVCRTPFLCQGVVAGDPRRQFIASALARERYRSALPYISPTAGGHSLPRIDPPTVRDPKQVIEVACLSRVLASPDIAQ